MTDEEIIEIEDREEVENTATGGRLVLALAMVAVGIGVGVIGAISESLPFALRLLLVPIGAVYAGFFAILAMGGNVAEALAAKLGLKVVMPPRQRIRTRTWLKRGLETKAKNRRGGGKS